MQAKSDYADLRKRLDDAAQWCDDGGDIFTDTWAGLVREASAHIAALERELEEIRHHARTSLGKWEHALFCRKAASEHLPGAEKASLLDGARVAERGIISDMTHIWKLVIPDEARLPRDEPSLAGQPSERAAER